jgi:tetratricopeptide (TPR) repeat protein
VAQADSLCDLAWQAMRRNPAFNPVDSPSIIAQLGAVRLAQQNYAEAETLLREALRLAEKHDLNADYRLALMNLLGASLSGQKKYAEAEPLLVQSAQGLQQRQSSLLPYLNPRRRITESFERLVQLYDAWGKAAAATEWKRKLTEFQQMTNATGTHAQMP